MDLTRPALRLLGFNLIGLAAVLGLVAFEHMRSLAALGPICGLAAPHCPACPASLASGLLGLAALAAAARRPRAAPAR